jgi:hypothetical protein
MNKRRSMMLLAAALFVVAAACSSDDTPAVTVTGPSLTTVPPLGTLPPPTTPPAGATTTTGGPSPTRPPVTAAPIDDPKPGVKHFVPVLPLEDGILSLDVVYVDGSVSLVRWPASIDIVSRGLIPYGWAFITGASSRDFFIRPGTIEEVLDNLGGAELLGEYPDGSGGMIGMWRPVADEVDYLGFQFGDWAVFVFDYRNTLQMSEDDRALWATSFHGEVSEDGFLVLSADYPLQLVFAGDYPEPLNMTMRGEDGEVTLTPGACEPGILDAVADDAFSAWCTEDGNMTITAYGRRDFQQVVMAEMEVVSVVIAEPPPLPEDEEE